MIPYGQIMQNTNTAGRRDFLLEIRIKVQDDVFRKLSGFFAINYN